MAHWFSEARFGMFIHWGLYAIPGGVWHGMDVPWGSEWVMRKYKIPIREYEKLAGEFNPAAFDAECWARSIRDAGMKYVVFTSKHHDGFAMFHSGCDKFNVYDATPFHRDVLQELSEACRKSGIRLGLYYSQDQDWHEPGASGNTWDFPEAEKTPDAFEAYLQKKVKPQLHELLTRYGDIGIVWFDTPVRITGEQCFMFRADGSVVGKFSQTTELLSDGRIKITSVFVAPEGYEKEMGNISLFFSFDAELVQNKEFCVTGADGKTQTLTFPTESKYAFFTVSNPRSLSLFSKDPALSMSIEPLACKLVLGWTKPEESIFRFHELNSQVSLILDLRRNPAFDFGISRQYDLSGSGGPFLHLHFRPAADRACLRLCYPHVCIADHRGSDAGDFNHLSRRDAGAGHHRHHSGADVLPDDGGVHTVCPDDFFMEQ